MMMMGITIKRMGAVNLCSWCFMDIFLSVGHSVDVDFLKAVHSILFLPIAHCFTLQVFLHLVCTNTWVHKFIRFHLLQILAYLGSSAQGGAETKTCN